MGNFFEEKIMIARDKNLMAVVKTFEPVEKIKHFFFSSCFRKVSRVNDYIRGRQFQFVMLKMRIGNHNKLHSGR
jgi:hypothetical protein